MGNFTAISVSQQVISDHNDTLMFSYGAEHPFVVLSSGHLILLIIYKLFKLYTGPAAWYLEHVCGLYCHLKHCVNRDQVPYRFSSLIRGRRRTVGVDTTLSGAQVASGYFTP